MIIINKAVIFISHLLAYLLTVPSIIHTPLKSFLSGFPSLLPRTSLAYEGDHHEEQDEIAEDIVCEGTFCGDVVEDFRICDLQTKTNFATDERS